MTSKQKNAGKAKSSPSQDGSAASDSKLVIEFPSEGEFLPLQRELVACARFVDGQDRPITNAGVTWSSDNASPPDCPLEVSSGTCFTDGEGRAYLPLFKAYDNVTADLHATATDPSTKQLYHASIRNLTFSDRFNGPGTITLVSEDGTELATDADHKVTAHYTLGDGSPANCVVLIWDAGQARIGPLTSVARNGYASSFISWRSRVATPPPRNFTVSASSENPLGNDSARHRDVGSLSGLNIYTAPRPLTLAVDKVFAANPFDGQFHPEQPVTTIRAALELFKRESTVNNAQATLNLSQFGAPVHLFGEDGKELQKAPDSPDGTHNYIAKLNALGRCDFQIMSPVFSLFTLTASYSADTSIPPMSQQLVIADVGNAPPGDIVPPRIQGLSQGVLPINPLSQTFRVSMDMEDADNIDDDATIVLLLNERVVFTGKGADLDEDNGGVQIGYAGLRSDGFNELVMIYNDAAIFKQRTFSTKPVRFTISGTPPPEPTPGSRRVRAPKLFPSSITAWNASQIRLDCSDVVIEPADIITVLCLFEDSDPLAQDRRNAVQFLIRPEDRLSEVFIPPMYLAGYSSGSTLRVYYSIVFNGERLWSDVAVATLDTASIPQGLAAAHLKQEH
jgi:hypothetical protein